MNAEQPGKGTCPQRDSAERKEHVGGRRSFQRIWKDRNSATSDLLEKMFSKENLVAAFKEVKKNHGAPGVDGMTIDEAQDWLNKHWQELTARIMSESIRQSRSDE